MVSSRYKYIINNENNTKVQGTKIILPKLFGRDLHGCQSKTKQCHCVSFPRQHTMHLYETATKKYYGHKKKRHLKQNTDIIQDINISAMLKQTLHHFHMTKFRS